MSGAQPGWYPDGSGNLRYWDGAGWTEHLAQGGPQVPVAPGYPMVVRTETNGIGTAGFVLAIIGIVFSWVPLLGWLSWLLGAIFSIIGVFKMPRGFAIAGLVLSFFGVIVLILFLTVFAGLIAFI
ncbi:DUF2510 domain-containing protein [Scrofimicrobium canadense]|nr:DUF2510 domain-containing protein [Scrofimicrobium canadense]